MGKKLNIAFLWHMHQPCYKDLHTNHYHLPWVRLHGIKGYYDMAKIVEEVEKARVTFNLVPSLLEQLSDYAEGIGMDIYLEHTLKEPSDLTREEKIFILSNFFHANHENMICPYPRYAELDSLRGDVSTVDQRLDQWSTQDFLDLQVWFNLTWFGQTIKDRDEEIQGLIRKGRGYSQGDKERVLAKQREVLQEVVPLYRSLADNGRIELTTSPFYHPILPLLCDTDEARNSMPGSSLPRSRFSFPEDADSQIRGGLSYHEAVFGRRPRGMWPSEGSVSDAALNLMARNGLVWTASDENILANTLRAKGREIRGREFLYQPYLWESEGGQLAMFFRDHQISDLIGFVYHRWFTPDAIGDLIHRLSNLKRELPSDRPNLVSIILDGENAWEYYYRNGYDFLTGIYRGLAEHPDLEMVTFSEYLWRHPIGERTKRIHPGSWINADFGTWIGQPAKNLAWEYLTRARQDIERYTPEQLSEEKVELAWHEMMIAEGSDWFWWLGDTHSSALDAEFDELFRIHLKNIYWILEQEAPAYLDYPIQQAAVHYGQEPTEMIHPTLDGTVGPGEWAPAGTYSFDKGSGAMQRSQYLIERLFYGFDTYYLYLRLEGNVCSWLQGSNPALEESFGHEPQIQFSLTHRQDFFIRVNAINKPGEKVPVELVTQPDELLIDTLPARVSERNLELAVPLEKLGLNSADQFGLQVIVKNEKGELERWPVHDPLQIQIV